MTIVVIEEGTVLLTKREWDRLIFEFKDRPGTHNCLEPWLRDNTHVLRRLRGDGGRHMSTAELEWPAQIGGRPAVNGGTGQ